MAADTASGYIQDTRKAALNRFLKKVSGGSPENGEAERRPLRRSENQI